MALALNKENYLLHKIHSLTGIVPVGYYMVQHLALNSFTLAGPEKFNGVIEFFESIPIYALLVLEIVAIWVPLLFHAVYGMFIISRAQPNYLGSKYGWSQNRMYTFQRWTGVFIFLFLAYHVFSTTGVKYYTQDAETIKYAAWQAKLTSYGYIFLLIYILGVAASAYHLAYGVWNFCIRWGITISDSAQMKIQKAAVVIFLGLTLLGWTALFGFLRHKPVSADSGERAAFARPSGAIPATNQR
ncbi:MAG: ferric reductase-like transmembrane domain-containing protein [Fimbriimonas sp.]